MTIIYIILLLILCLSIFRFKSVILKLILLISLYPLLQLFIFLNDIPLSGIIDFNSYLFSEKAVHLAFNSYLAGEYIFFIILWPLRNEIYSYKPINIGSGMHFTLLILFIISSYSVFQIRSESGGTASLYLVFSTLLIFCKKGGVRNVYTLLQLAFLIFVIMMGERVDSIMAIVLLIVLDKDGEEIIEKYNKKFLYSSLLLLFVVSIISAFIRSSMEYDLNSLARSFYSQQTVADVLFVYLCGAEYYVSHGFAPEVLNNLFFGYLPGEYRSVTSSFYYGRFLINNFADNPGGGLFFTEGLLAFGPFGVPIYLSLLAITLKFLFKSKNRISVLVFILFFIMICRIMWYGLVYTYTPIVLLVICYVLIISVKSPRKPLASSSQ